MLSIAKAVYDNEAETAEELSFERDDTLVVLEKDFRGLLGWWYCSLRGKTGIAPGNRLQIIQEIREKPSAGSRPVGPGPRRLSHTTNQTDYDCPKPGLPRKMGSCDDLLSFAKEEDEDSDDVTPLGRSTGVRGGTGRQQRGGSCENILNLSCHTPGSSLGSSTLDILGEYREYDVPVSSMTSEEREPPREASLKGRGVNQTQMGFNEEKRGGFSGKKPSPEVACRSPGVAKPSGHPLQTRLFQKDAERDSALADYDTPKHHVPSVAGAVKTGSKGPTGSPISPGSNAPTGSKVSPGIKPTAGSMQAAANRSIECSTPGGKSAPVSPLPAGKATSSQSPVAERLRDQSLLTSLAELRNAVDQVISYADKWSACKNPDTTKSIVKHVCVSVWKKLYAFLVNFSKLLTDLQGLPGMIHLKDRFGALNVSADDLEKVLNTMERNRRPNDNSSLDFVREFVIIARDVRTHVDYCNSLLSGDVDDFLNAPDLSDAPHGANILPSQPVPPPSRTRPQNEPARREPDENFSRSAGFYPRYLSATSPPGSLYNNRPQLDTPDYDVPTSSRVEVRPGVLVLPGSRTSVGILRNVRACSADTERFKRNAVVVGKSQESFNILETRELGSPPNPRKLVTSKLRSPDSGPAKSPGWNSHGIVDYDYPTSSHEREENNNRTSRASRDSGEPMSAKDAQMLKFYNEPVKTSLLNLVVACREVKADFCRSPAKEQRVVLPKLEALMLAVRKLVFVCDTLGLKLEGERKKKEAIAKSTELTTATKSIFKLVSNSSNTAVWTQASRQMLFESIDELMKMAVELRSFFASAET